MGTDLKKKIPPLPAPTETDTATPTELASDLATDVSKPGDDISTYSLREDGTPVTIKTRGHKLNKSQTSLLIEYFEGGKVASSKERKPSVRVRLTPSKKGQGDHFQVTETKGSRKVSLTRRIPPLDHAALGDLQLPEVEDAHSMTSYASATEESNVSRNPIDIEIERSQHRRRRPASPLIPSEARVSYQPGNPSEISAIPTDSFLDGTGPSSEARHSRGDALAAAAANALAAAAAAQSLSSRKIPNSDKDRAQVLERSTDKSSEKKRRPKNRTASIGEHASDETRSPRRRSSRSHQDSNISGGDSSLLSSNLSAGNRSVKSNASKSSSINNPKLLETVEDAIRRLILPELSALKREQSKREGRRSSIASTGTSVSRDDVSIEKRRSSDHKPDSSKDSTRPKEKRNREARHDYENISMHNTSRESLGADYLAREEASSSPLRGSNLFRAAGAGATAVAAAKGISSFDDNSETLDKKQRDRRRRRADQSRSRSVGRDVYVDDYDEEEPAPPMPLMSDINPSEVTRTSILSAETDRPHSATEEAAPTRTRQIQQHPVSVSSTPTPPRSPTQIPKTLFMQHANVSQGDLTALPRGKKEYIEEFETDEFGRKVPASQYDYFGGHNSHDVPEFDEYMDEAYANSLYNVQDVPPPLKYVPYQAGARGLSPIPSVSGYTEGGSEAPLPHTSKNTQVVDSYSSPDKSSDHRRQAHSIPSFDSLQSGDNPEPQYVAGQEVRGISANPNVINTPVGVESAVASLVDGSALEQSVATGMSGMSGHEHAAGTRDSALSSDEHAQLVRSSGVSATPEKMSRDSPRQLEEEANRTPVSRSVSRSQEYSEYDLDEHGRKIHKVRCRHSPTASEAVITAGAVGAAAAALKAAQERRQAGLEIYDDENFQPAGVSRNKSFKERAMGWKPRIASSHGVHNFDEEPPVMTASGMPDMDNPMPEIGYMDNEIITNPSLLDEVMDSEQPNWNPTSGRATPTPQTAGAVYEEEKNKILKGVPGIATGAAAAGTAALTTLTRDQELEEEWRRTSAECKRDTLVTNPYEDASPIANPTLDDGILDRGAADTAYAKPYGSANPGLAQKYGEDYMPNGPNRTPDVGVGKSLDSAAGQDREDDPFYVSKPNPRHLSGLSQGMQSPLYDAATGAGIERIENKDVVALMQHLMVRDAQRSARDTEIVALLMNAAVEMRNSFREMKELVQDTGDDVIFANVDNTEKLQKAINGPRPYPSTGTRSLRSSSQGGTLDEAVKKKNLWKRALQGLSAKGTNDLTRIEDMLVQLLGEVDVLKLQTAPPVSTDGQGRSLENLQPEAQQERDKGYEAEEILTASHSSAHAQCKPAVVERKYSDYRISTVPEQDEEYDYGSSTRAPMQTKTGKPSAEHGDRMQRGEFVVAETSPQTSSEAQQAATSPDNMARSEKGKNHKSSSSSGWIPKISRWSETTASSVGRAFRGSGISKKGSKQEDLPPSRSGSSLSSCDDGTLEYDLYGVADKLHTGFSNPNLDAQDGAQTASASFGLSDDVKYKAHRNSVNLQHPQPRQGPTDRYHSALEYSAREFDNPLTPRSADWAGSATSLNRLQGSHNRYSAVSSGAARETDYGLSLLKQQQQQQHCAPARPSKEPLDSVSVHTPSKSNRMSSQQQKNSPVAATNYESGFGSASGHYTSQVGVDGSPKIENRNLNAALSVPSRRPSGPRAMTPKSPEEAAAREERRRKRDAFGTMGGQDVDTF